MPTPRASEVLSARMRIARLGQGKVISMEVRSAQAQRAISGAEPIRLDLGAGESPRPGFLSVDIRHDTDPDFLADLEDGLAGFPDSSVEAIYSSHTLEHLARPLDLLAEIHRVLQPNGVAEIVVPHWSNPYYFSDPTHIRPFGLYSFFYVTPLDLQPPTRKVPLYRGEIQFCVESLQLEFYGYTFADRLWRKTFARWINGSFRRQNFFERRLANYLHAWQIRVTLRVLK